MTHILDYLNTNLKTFEEAPFNAVDSACLSAFCMTELDDILADMPGAQDEADPRKRYFLPWRKKEGAGLKFADFLKAEHYPTMFKGFIKDSAWTNLMLLASSPRFRDITIHSYRSTFDAEAHLQFAATTFIYKDMFAYIGFRGTDTSVAGWREDFNMACSSPIPAQEEALVFLQQTIARLPKNLEAVYVGGHSKGANLAVYSSMFSPIEIQKRITRVFDHDGPGFRPEIIPYDAPVIARIHKTVPAESVVGLIMTSPCPIHPIASSQKGLLQHDLYTWKLDGNDFVYLDEVSDGSRLMGNITKAVVAQGDVEELNALVNLLFGILESTGAEQIPEITSDWKKTVPLMIEAASKTDKNERDAALRAAKLMAEAIVDQFKGGLK